jgi:hypothetical protein
LIVKEIFATHSTIENSIKTSWIIIQRKLLNQITQGNKFVISVSSVVQQFDKGIKILFSSRCSRKYLF